MFLLISGKEVEIGDKSTYVLATVLKEFFRSLPESLICSEIFAEMCSTKDITDSTERIEEMKRYFTQGSVDQVPLCTAPFYF